MVLSSSFDNGTNADALKAGSCTQSNSSEGKTEYVKVEGFPQLAAINCTDEAAAAYYASVAAAAALYNVRGFGMPSTLREKKDLIAQIEALAMHIKELTEAIATLKSEIAEMQVQLKRAGEDREKQNKEFQQTVADQRATQKLLNAALEILKGFYEKKEAALLQQEPAGPPPPPGFKEYKKNAAAGGVMGMIQQIINDAKAMEADAIRSEEDAQKAYEDFVKETNASIEAKSKEMVNKTEEKAKAETDLTESNEAKENVLLELEQLSNYNAELHQSCDFVMKNFEIRQTARDEEIDALKQAKAILSGAKFSEFLQMA